MIQELRAEEEIIKSLTEDGTVLYIQMVPDNEAVKEMSPVRNMLNMLRIL